ncbi:tyrosine-type recombinase/integrase [Streptomyces sp. NPDC087525]|uniref:tyrosine-type recombinase/integrase n=1 Tax=Streptomyces sp. NPDC087525 TaxID=3365793 RepID=UPI00381D92F0
MAGYIEDRWFKKGPADPKTGKPTRAKTDRHGKGKRWRVAGITGVRDRSFTREADAKTWLKASATDSTRGTFYDPRDGEITLAEYVTKTWWPSLRVGPGTKQSMKPRVFNHILPHVGQLPLNRIGHDEVKAWLMRVEQDIDVGTVRTTWRHFSSILQAAHKAKRIPENPFRDEDLSPPTAPPSKAKAWPEETVTAVRDALGLRYGILMDLAVGAGLRQGECFGFSPDDVDGEEIHVCRQVVKIGGKLAFAPPKGGKPRDTVCPPELAAAVKEYVNSFSTVEVTLPWIDPDRPSLPWEKRPLVTVRLLVTTTRTAGRSGGAINRTTFDYKQWKPSLVKAGVIPEPDVEYIQAAGKKPWARKEWKMPREDGFHATRHTFASIVLQSGETITQLAAWLGHTDPAFTLRTYTHFMPRSGMMAIAALGGWVSPGGAGTPAGKAVVAPEGSNASGSPQILPRASHGQGK